MVAKNITACDLNSEMKLVVLPVTILIGAEAVCGLVGNVMIIFIYSSKYPHCNFRYFVISMAAVDLISCLTTLPGEIFSQLNWYDFKHDWICKIKSYFNVFTAWSSGLLLMCLAFDRYRKICRPLKWQVSHACARRLCCLCAALATVVAVPITILWGKQTYQYDLDGVQITVSICEKASLYVNTPLPFLYILVVYIVPFGVMLVTISVLNVLTAMKLFCGMENLSHCNNSYNSVECDDPHCDLTKATELLDVSELSVRLKTTVKSPPRIHCAGFRCLEPVSGEMAANDVNRHNGDAVRHERNGGAPNEEKTSLQLHEDTLTAHLTSHDSEQNLHRFGSSMDHATVRLKRKTWIMLILTSVFIVTMAMYVVLLSLVATTDGILQELSNADKVVFFLFWRLYFVNCVINPILYGVLDPRFRKGLHDVFCRFRGAHDLKSCKMLRR